MKKFIAFVFAALFAAGAWAHEYEVTVNGVTWYYNRISDGKGGYNAEITYRGSSYNSYSNEYSGSLTIPPTLGGYSVTSIASSAFYGCSSLTSIKMPNSVTSIGSHAFYNCSSLASVTIPESVTTIWDYAFCNCSSLTSVTIPSSVTTIGNSAFSICSSLTSVTIPESVTTIGGQAFYNCSSLVSVTIPESVTEIGSSAFSNCSSLTSVTIPDSVTTIGYDAFRGCSSLTSVAIPDSVTTIETEAFYGTPFYDNQPDGLVIIGNGYLYKYKGTCPSSVTIPDSVTTIGSSAFYGCSSLTSVTIPSSVTTIGSYAFEYCSSLTSVTIPSSVTTIGSSAFNGCSKLQSFTVAATNPSYRAIDGVLYTKDGLTLVACPDAKTSVAIPSSVTTIGGYAFSRCSSLTSVTIPESVTTIGVCAFSDCSSLTSVTIPSSVTTIGSLAFYGCSSLTSVKIPSSVTTIGKYAFVYCSSLTSVTIPSSVTTIGGYAFDGCPLSEVWVEAGDEDRVKWLLADSYGFDVSSLTFREIPKQESDSGEGNLRIAFVVSDGEASLAEASYPTNGVYGRLPEARREGFTFAGWYTAFDGGKRVGAFSTINPEVTTLYARWVEQDASLYAQWAANVYAVNFNANGGSGAMAAQPFLYDQTQPLSANGFTKTGYTFKGWSTSPEGEVVFADAAAVSNLTTEAGFAVALFAQWNKTVELDTDDISDWVAYDLADQYAAKHGTNARGYRDLFRSTFGNDYSAAFHKETGKVAADGTRLQVWHDYVAGTDPLDPESKFTASMTVVDGKPVISWMPELDPERAAMRKYTTCGKVKLTDKEWVVVPEGRASDYNFFKVTVEMK